MTEQAFITDGFSSDAFFARKPGIYPDVNVTYRPLYGDRRAAFMSALQRLSQSTKPVDLERFISAMVSDHILEWDIAGEKSEPLEITAENVHRLQPLLRTRLYNLCAGAQGGDDKPATNEKASHQEEIDGEAAYKAAMAGESVEEFTAKN